MEDPGRLTRRRLFWLLQTGGWALFGFAMFLAGVSQWSVAYAALNKSSLTLFGFLSSLLLRIAYRALSRRRVPVPFSVAAAIPSSFGAAGVWMAAHHFVLACALPGGFRRALSAFPDVTNTIYFFFLLAAWSALYFGIPAYLDLLAERERLLVAEARAHEARLEALRYQLNPHFLFNTLNAISTLVSEARNAEANRMLSRLAEFLRTTLDGNGGGQVRLSDEIAFTRQYLEIEQIRFGDRLRVEIDVPPELERALVPPMILQPLVENALRHAIFPRERGGMISLSAVRENGRLNFEVGDDGPGIADSSAIVSGVGLTNTRARLSELFGARAEMSLSRSGLGGLAVTVRFPFVDGGAEAP